MTPRIPQYQAFWTAIVLVALAGCAHNPFKAAQGPQEQTWVVLKEYRNILETQVLPAMRDDRVPESVRRALGDLNRKGTPAVVALARSVGVASRVRAEVAAGVSSPEQLSSALEALSQAVDEVKQIVTDFKSGLKGAHT